jgi:hypothetical protein
VFSCIQAFCFFKFNVYRYPSGHLVGSGAGPQIEAHDHVFRLNGHNAPGTFTLRANDFGHRTDFRALSSAAINAGRVGYHFSRRYFVVKTRFN